MSPLTTFRKQQNWEKRVGFTLLLTLARVREGHVYLRLDSGFQLL